MKNWGLLNSIERKVILSLGDIFIIFISLKLFYDDAIDKKIDSTFTEFVLYFLGISCFLIIAYVLDFYNLENSRKLSTIIRQSGYITGSFVLIVFLFFVLFFDASFWRLNLILFLTLTPVQIFLWRLLFRNLFKIIPGDRNVLYIYDETSESIKDECIKIINGVNLETYYKVKLSFSIERNIVGNRKIFKDSLKNIDSFIINVKDYNNLPKDLETLLLKNIAQGKEVLSYTSFYENIYEALPIQSHNDSFYEILQLRNRRIRYFKALFTFFMELILGLSVGAVFLIVIPFVWFCNLFFNRGPLFYTQKRVGKFGKEFKIYKFRSMVVDAEKSGAQMAQANDTRITPFGKILRKTRIDELPQIISIINGDMSFIGPRPERKVFTKQLNKMIPFYNVRHLVNPGITGWAQVKYKYGENLDDSIKKLEYDLYYIKNRSITLELRIIFKTVTTVLFSRGQ